MNISWLTIRDLEYLVTTGRLLHFRKAAEACHVSQPALSSQIKKIERLLGVRIFERTNRRVSLTDVGRLLVSQAQVVLEEASKIGMVARKERTGESLQGVLRLGAIATLGPYYMPQILSPLKKEFPDLQLVLREGLTDELLAELRNGGLDVVLAARTFDESGLRVAAIFEEPFLLAVPNNHPLARKKPLYASDMKASEMVLLEDGHCLRDQALEICPPNRRGNIRRFHAASLETLRHLVASGMGYTLVPKMAVTQDSRIKGLLKYRKFQGDPIGRTIVAVCRESYPRMDEFEKLVEFLKKIALKRPALQSA